MIAMTIDEPEKLIYQQLWQKILDLHLEISRQNVDYPILHLMDKP
ncbi:hypothetical protein N9301_05995 [Paracoccaceae bacterium]|nr:hypothetical protein [Paracoccaceae bacterium]